MKNIDVIEAFIKHLENQSINLKSTGNKLFSYNTCIAEYCNNNLYINDTRYSTTTSKHRNMLKRKVDNYIAVTNVSIGSQTLIKFNHEYTQK